MINLEDNSTDNIIKGEDNLIFSFNFYTLR